MRTARRILFAAGWLLLLVVAAIAHFFVWPPEHEPGRIDAVVMLSGDHGERLPLALRLVDERPNAVLVLAGTPDTQRAVELCSGGQRFEVVCLRPNPDSTRAEARATAKLASDRRWRRIAVVTSRYHATRAGILFRRCFDGDVETVGGRPEYSVRMAARAVVHEIAGTAYAVAMDRSC